MSRKRRRSRRNRIVGALALAVVAIATLAFTSPAVGRPIVRPGLHPAELSSTVTLAVVALACAATLALVIAVAVVNTRRSRKPAVDGARDTASAPRLEKMPRRERVAA